MKKLLLSLVLAAASAASAQVPFKLGIARYTMHKAGLYKALDIMQTLDTHYLGLIEGSIRYDASEAEIAAYKAHCAKYGVEVVSAGPLYYSTESELKACCEFARRYGMKYISVVPFEWNPKIAHITGDDPAKVNAERRKILPPSEWRIESDRMMDVLEDYCRKYDLRAAVHNHGPDNAYLYPTGEASLKRIGNRDRRIGVCLDVGHERRAGLDPAAFIRRHGDRIVEVHMKNIKIDPVRNFARIGSRGELDIPGIMQALADVGFDGYCLVEYETDFDDNLVPLAESIGYYRGCMDAVKAKAVLQPVPAGANTLTAAERAEGYELLFDGVNLPTDTFVGVKEAFKAFPKKGWFVKDGCLTMRPVSGIANGTWFALPPEDQKLGGGGDIATVKKYRDFAFKFDFRLTAAANSGVKYFLDETQNGGTCEEYQILENGHPDASKGVDGNRKAASLYDIYPAHADALLRGVGQWNSGMVVAKGGKVEHWLNGVKVLEYTRGTPAFKAAVRASKYATWGKSVDGTPQDWGEIPEGRLLLQDHSDSTVSFCNLKVKEL